MRRQVIPLSAIGKSSDFSQVSVHIDIRRRQCKQGRRAAQSTTAECSGCCQPDSTRYQSIEPQHFDFAIERQFAIKTLYTAMLAL
tara:strand:- start:90 stop:344 length:255 start_codon:yes stop_codon:yes gene_type:complete